MKVVLRLPNSLRANLQADIARRHDFAFERVAFCSLRVGNLGNEPTIVLAGDPIAVPDEQYVRDPVAGARIDSSAIRAAMQRVLDTRLGAMHVHVHDFPGQVEFSKLDMREIPRLVQSLRHVNSDIPHGMLVLGPDSARAAFLLPGRDQLVFADKISFVGTPTRLVSVASRGGGQVFSRQTFLGPTSEQAITTATVGVIGLGGGGSHLVQQLAHIGFRNFVLYDEQTIDETNLNRLVGATAADVAAATRKVDIASRVIRSVTPDASVQSVASRWQDSPSALRGCDVVFGAVDGFDERRQLETTCRRYLIPLIDIGMDVQPPQGGQPFRMAGQVILSVPNMPCMQCLGFLNERNLGQEARRYGAAGPRPQVVWSNGVLASAAVGIGVDLLTNWSGRLTGPAYLSYDGNANALSPHPRLMSRMPDECPHHKLVNVGDPIF